MESRRFSLSLTDGGTLAGLLDLPERRGPHPAVVVCHGFKGFARWGFFPPLAELLATRGFAVVRFNFRGSGMGLDDELVSDPASFRADRYLQELADLEELLARLEEIGGEAIDPSRTALLGHSRGGAVALLAAARSSGTRRLRALVTWNAIGRCDRWSLEEKERWRREGELPVVNARTGQRLALGLALLEELEQQRDELDLLAAARRMRTPWLLLHGTSDESVPFTEGQALAGAASEVASVRFQAIAGGGHTFGAKHPFAGPTPQLTAAMNATQRFLRRELCGA